MQAGGFRLRVPCDRSAPAQVRRALERCCEPGWALGDVMLIATEIVSNAVSHSGGRPEDVVEVDFEVEAERASLSVSDPGASGRAVVRPTATTDGGFGLRVVDLLATRWGEERDPGGRHRVWAEVACPGVEGRPDGLAGSSSLASGGGLAREGGFAGAARVGRTDELTGADGPTAGQAA